MKEPHSQSSATYVIRAQKAALQYGSHDFWLHPPLGVWSARVLACCCKTQTWRTSRASTRLRGRSQGEKQRVEAALVLRPSLGQGETSPCQDANGPEIWPSHALHTVRVQGSGTPPLQRRTDFVSWGGAVWAVPGVRPCASPCTGETHTFGRTPAARHRTKGSLVLAVPQGGSRANPNRNPKHSGTPRHIGVALPVRPVLPGLKHN